MIMTTVLDSTSSPSTVHTGVHRHAQAPRLLLASRSPRRRSLLTEFGLAHDAEHPGFDDAVLNPGSVGPRQWVASLAYLKASTKAAELQRSPLPASGVIVLGADTICLQQDRFIGTPASAGEAREMLRHFSGTSHEVLTGVALVSLTPGKATRRQIFVDSATVRVAELSDEMINEYVESGTWQGKAGGYNLAERLEAGWPIEYDGDPTTIMGLPMRQLVVRLGRLGVVTSPAKAS
jgi:septum formation protein